MTDRPRITEHTEKCSICRTHRALTGPGQLFALAVRGEKRDYVRYICEDCVSLFNTSNWSRARKVLSELKKREIPVAHLARQTLDPAQVRELLGYGEESRDA